MRKLFPLLFLATSLSAAPAITSISPSSGPAAGGNIVVIRGTGFESCPTCSPPVPPGVWFGGMPAPSVRLVSDRELEVIAPAHLPGTVDVAVDQWNGFARREAGFTFTGTVEESFQRILVPLLTPQVFGPFGSDFRTELRLANTSDRQATFVFGLQIPCPLSGCIAFDPFQYAYAIQGGQSIGPHDYDYIGNPGRFLFIARSLPDLDANLRVYDASRSAFNFGTEIPVVREAEFARGSIKLLGVPRDPRFRNTLRIYALEELTVQITGSFSTGPFFTETVTLRRGQNLFDPAYAQFSNIPMIENGIPLDITVSAVVPANTPEEQQPLLWAFVSVTNNETQLITTISPQR
jgi:IPT/TIG domain